MMGCHVLLVGEDPELRSLLAQQLDVTAASTASEALDLLGSRHFPLMIACDPFPGGTVLSLLPAARRISPLLKVVVVSSRPTPESAREAMRAGVDDFLDRGDPGLARLPWIAARLAGELTQAPGALIGSISHDMRSPLAALDALLQMIEDGADGPLTDPQRSRLARIRSTLDRLAAIARELSDLSLLNDGRLPLSRGRVDPSDAVSWVMQQVEPLARARAVALRLAFPASLPSVQADAARLRQALALTVSAALRQADGGTVELSAEAPGAHLVMRLRELPRSIPVEALPSGFESSPAGLPAEADRLDGSLGIAVARALLRLHGGELRTRPASSDGTLCVIEIPCEEPAPAGRADRRRDRHPRPG